MTDGSFPEKNNNSESIPFPISKESVDKTLANIAEDPDKAIVEEQTIIEKENPQLAHLLKSTASTLSSIPTVYLEGGLWTHKIIREQAGLRGGKLPTVSPNIAMGHLKDNVQTTTVMGKNVEDHFLKMKNEMEVNEPELARALLEMTKYRSNGKDFYEGAMNVYLPIKKTLDAQALEKKLGF